MKKIIVKKVYKDKDKYIVLKIFIISLMAHIIGFCLDILYLFVTDQYYSYIIRENFFGTFSLVSLLSSIIFVFLLSKKKFNRKKMIYLLWFMPYIIINIRIFYVAFNEFPIK